MRGAPSRCYVCGVVGEVYGVPTFYDRCTDEEACCDRVIANKEREIKRLQDRVKEFEATIHVN